MNIKMAWKICVSFFGNQIPKQYITPDVRHNDPGWGGELFNRQIESLEFFLPTGHKLVLTGMEAYNFFIEAAEDLNSKGRTSIEAFWFCGKLPQRDIVEMWCIRQGKVVRQQKPWGKEWGGTPTRGWKMGTMGNPVSRLVRV